MIATLRGKVSEKTIDSVVLDVNGTGYGLLVTAETYNNLELGEEVKLYVYEHIRENVYDLYGFSDIETQNLFVKLVSISGVGPKVALNILSVGTVNRVRQAIAGGDIRLIQSAQGVGKKMAERVLVELKDKVGLISSLDESTLLIGDEAAQQDEAVQALVALGYSIPDAINSLRNVDKELPTKERVTLALKSR